MECFNEYCKVDAYDSLWEEHCIIIGGFLQQDNNSSFWNAKRLQSQWANSHLSYNILQNHLVAIKNNANSETKPDETIST